MDERTLERLYAYHDGELSGPALERFESELRTSAELRAELSLLQETAAAARELDAAGAFLETQVPDLWPDIRRGLAGPGPAVVRRPVRRARRWWLPLGALATATAAGLVGWLVLGGGLPAGPAPDEGPRVAGTVRYLDTGGQGVVVHDREDVTIVWLIGSDEA